MAQAQRGWAWGWNSQAGSDVQEGLGTLAASAVGLRVAGLSWGGAWGPPAGGWRAATGQVGGSLFLYLAVGIPTSVLLPDSPESRGVGNTLPGILLVAPVAEELLYRGDLQPALRLRWGRFAGILLPALLFGLGHPGLARFAHTAVFGLLCGLLRERTGSLLPCIALHGATNALGVAAQSDPRLLGVGLLGGLAATLWGLAGARGYLRVLANE